MQKFLALILIILIKHLRPLLGGEGCCRYTIGCTQYSLILLEDVRTFGAGLLPALWSIAKRVLTCHPFAKN